MPDTDPPPDGTFIVVDHVAADRAERVVLKVGDAVKNQAAGRAGKSSLTITGEIVGRAVVEKLEEEGR